MNPGSRRQIVRSCAGPAAEAVAAKQRGVALAVVVWFIAGMSLLVAGIVSTASVDTRMAQLHVARAKVSAAGDGAVQLALADLVAGRLALTGDGDFRPVSYRLGDVEVAVTLVSTTGLINLNTAPREVLVALFEVAAAMDKADAQLVADNVLNWRAPAAQRSITDKESARFREVEDLLRVDGVTRGVLDSIRAYVAAGNTVRGSMDWAQAPAQVLSVLRDSDPRKYEAVVQRKASLARAAMGTTAGGREVRPGSVAGGTFRADTVVRYGDRTWLRRHWVTITGGRESVLPWHLVRTEAARVIAG